MEHNMNNGEQKFIGYHGTDEDSAHKILKSEFICKKSKEHWLGNGFYFFLDKALAKYWCNNPTLRFGVRISNPSIIEIEAICECDYILDMRFLGDFSFVEEEYVEFFDYFSEENEPENEITMCELRCIFFDWLVDKYKFKIVIAYFYKESPSYRNNKYGRPLDEFKIPYSEIQMCLYDNNIIKKKTMQSGD